MTAAAQGGERLSNKGGSAYLSAQDSAFWRCRQLFTCDSGMRVRVFMRLRRMAIGLIGFNPPLFAGTIQEQKGSVGQSTRDVHHRLIAYKE